MSASWGRRERTENKYTLLSREYAYRDVPALHEEELASFRQVFLDAGIDAFF